MIDIWQSDFKHLLALAGSLDTILLFEIEVKIKRTVIICRTREHGLGRGDRLGMGWHLCMPRVLGSSGEIVENV